MNKIEKKSQKLIGFPLFSVVGILVIKGISKVVCLNPIFESNKVAIYFNNRINNSDENIKKFFNVTVKDNWDLGLVIVIYTLYRSKYKFHYSPNSLAISFSLFISVMSALDVFRRVICYSIALPIIQRRTSGRFRELSTFVIKAISPSDLVDPPSFFDIFGNVSKEEKSLKHNNTPAVYDLDVIPLPFYQ